MRKLSLFTVLIMAVSMLSSCQVIGDLMKASFVAGILVVVVVVLLIIWLIAKMRG